MRIALLGAPGSGKGTQAKLLADKYRVPHISMGDLLREAVAKERHFGKGVRAAMEAGNLAADEVVIELLEERLRKKDTKRGFIIDGFPRNIPQAQALDTLLGMMGRNLQVTVNVHVEEDVLVKRITGRIICEECDAIYNKHFLPPKVRGKCDMCGAKKLVSGNSDSVKIIEVRVQVYNELTAPLITYYRAQHKLRTINSMDGIETVHQKICDIVDLEIRPLEIKTLETAAETLDEEEDTIIAGGQINRIPAEEVEARRAAAEARAEQIAKLQEESKQARQEAKPEKAEKPEKSTAKKSTSKKKTKTKKTATKTAVAGKTATKETAAKKSTAKKASKKSAAKKSATKKKVEAKKKTSSKKKVSKKTTKKKVSTKKKAVAKKKTSSKKKVSKKTTKKKVSTKKKVTSKKKTATNKAAKKTVQKKTASKKSSKKKAVSKKVSKKKTSKKKTGKKSGRKS